MPRGPPPPSGYMQMPPFAPNAIMPPVMGHPGGPPPPPPPPGFSMGYPTAGPAGFPVSVPLPPPPPPGFGFPQTFVPPAPSGPPPHWQLHNHAPKSLPPPPTTPRHRGVIVIIRLMHSLHALLVLHNIRRTLRAGDWMPRRTPITVQISELVDDIKRALS